MVELVDLRMHNPGSGAATGTQNIRHDHRYDHSGRLINYLFKLNADEVHVAEYNYDTYDQMVERNLHANFTAGTWAWMQSVDYTYNNMGWLTKINSNSHTGTALAFPTGSCAPSLPNPGTTTRDYLPETNDLFYLELRYDQLFDNTTGGGNISGITGGTIQKAGNISQLAYRVRGRDRQAYNFSYDHLSRLTAATYYDVNGSNTATNTSRFNESLTYDIRGNISTLQRQGYYSSSCNYGQIDNLSYTYTPSTNRLASINETAPATQKSHGFNPGSGGAGYTYDSNGNLISDSYKGISSISYNHLNLPSVITYSNGNNIEIVYDANGGKLRKMVKVGATLQYEQDYLGGLEYRKVGTNAKRLEAVYHDEGRYYNLNVEISNTLSIRREYSLRDHLGNTRLTFTDKNANGIVDITNNSTTSDILQENHYYPFGANYEGPWLMNDAARDTKYQYNGKEINDDFGLNWNDYGARWYDAAIGKWNGVDPLADKFTSWSPYNYVYNNPLRFIDPNGMSVDSLKPTGSASALAALSSIISNGSGGYYSSSIDAGGNLRMNSTGQEGTMTGQQTAFVATMNEAVNSTGNVSLAVLDHNDPASQNVVVGDSGSSPNSANPGSHSIDVGDMQAVGTTGLVTAQSMLAHEVAEGKAMQVDGRSAGAAHTINARAAESRVTGFAVGMTTVNSANGVITSLTVPITRGFNNIQNVQINVTGGQITGTVNNNR